MVYIKILINVNWIKVNVLFETPNSIYIGLVNIKLICKK